MVDGCIITRGAITTPLCSLASTYEYGRIGFKSIGEPITVNGRHYRIRVRFDQPVLGYGVRTIDPIPSETFRRSYVEISIEHATYGSRGREAGEKVRAEVLPQLEPAVHEWMLRYWRSTDECLRTLQYIHLLDIEGEIHLRETKLSQLREERDQIKQRLGEVAL